MKILKKTISLDTKPVMSHRDLRKYFEPELRDAEKYLDTLTEQQTADVLDFWNHYSILESAGWAAYYTARTGVFDVRYVPHDLFYAEIDRILNNPVRAYGLDDKLLYYSLFPKECQPRLLAAKIAGILYDPEHRVITAQEVRRICEDEGDIVVKPPIMTCGGTGVMVLHLTADSKQFEKLINASHDVIIQSKLRQHPDIAVFHPQSVNTVRLLTYLRENGEVVVLSSVLRMGAGDMQVDNVGSGGLTCGVRADGSLNETGFDNAGYRIAKHPDGVAFAGHKIPCYRKICEMSCELHYHLPQFAMLSWDIMVNENSEPIIIEINIGKPSIDFMQLNNGPLFGDYTEEILDRTYRLEIRR